MNLSKTVPIIFVVVLLFACLYIYNTKKNDVQEVQEEPHEVEVQVVTPSMQERINETYIHPRTYKEQ